MMAGDLSRSDKSLLLLEVELMETIDTFYFLKAIIIISLLLLEVELMETTTLSFFRIGNSTLSLLLLEVELMETQHL